MTPFEGAPGEDGGKVVIGFKSKKEMADKEVEAIISTVARTLKETR